MYAHNDTTHALVKNMQPQTIVNKNLAHILAFYACFVCAFYAGCTPYR